MPTLRRLPFILKTVPLELINVFQQSAGLRVDLPFARRWGVELGANAVFNSWTLANIQGEHYRGIKWRGTLKYYLKSADKNDVYIGLAFKYNDLYHDRFVNVLRQGGQYSEQLLQRRHLDIWAIGCRFGFQSYLGKQKRLVLEPFSGFGLRYTRIREDAVAPDAELIQDGNFFNFIREPGHYTYPDIMVGFFLGWVLGRH